ncbi:hypothetical protein AMELA_G00209820 [Ameiurus melas]|uniref:Stanniocalcin n=1 Tax=Ameiurus melas TaxID=219545 RepID=A0A7J6A4A1_AMEME|nr:hypothetical protein AMELA_G00209820 [Ameiurus melas]
MYVKLAVVVLVLTVRRRLDATDTSDSHERPLNVQKRRLSIQDTVEIQQCLLSAGDVGCGTFECFNNDSCEVRGLHDICLRFLHNAGKFDSQHLLQGKSFIKDALKCMAHGLRHKFTCISRKCVSVKEMVFQLQRECYHKHNLCPVVRKNIKVVMEMIHFQDLFPKGLSPCLPGHTKIQAVTTLSPVPAMSNTNFLPPAGPPLPQPDGQQV